MIQGKLNDIPRASIQDSTKVYCFGGGEEGSLGVPDGFVVMDSCPIILIKGEPGTHSSVLLAVQLPFQIGALHDRICGNLSEGHLSLPSWIHVLPTFISLILCAICYWRVRTTKDLLKHHLSFLNQSQRYLETQ